MLSPETLYVNASCSAAPTDVLRPAVLYQDARTAPIIANASDYRCAIARFTCVGLDLPIHIVPMASSSTANSIYTVTVASTVSSVTTTTTTSVPWTSQYVDSTGAALPISAGLPTDAIQYWAVTYHALLTQINAAIATSVTAQNTARSLTTNAAVAPQFRRVGNSFQLLVSNPSSPTSWSNTGATTFFSLSVSRTLGPLLDGFPSQPGPTSIKFILPSNLPTAEAPSTGFCILSAERDSADA